MRDMNRTAVWYDLVGGAGPFAVPQAAGAKEIYNICRIEFALAPAVFTEMNILPAPLAPGDVGVVLGNTEYDAPEITFDALDPVTGTDIYIINFRKE